MTAAKADGPGAGPERLKQLGCLEEPFTLVSPTRAFVLGERRERARRTPGGRRFDAPGGRRSWTADSGRPEASAGGRARCGCLSWAHRSCSPIGPWIFSAARGSMREGPSGPSMAVSALLAYDSKGSGVVSRPTSSSTCTGSDTWADFKAGWHDWGFRPSSCGSGVTSSAMRRRHQGR